LSFSSQNTPATFPTIPFGYTSGYRDLVCDRILLIRRRLGLRRSRFWRDGLGHRATNVVITAVALPHVTE
jgi:hypothetical protein